MTEIPRGRSAGFTLIELLVALALAGLVSLLLVHGINLAAFGFDRLSRGAERLDETRGVDQVLRRALGSAAAIPGLGPGIGFSGSPARISFLSLASDSGPGLYRVEIALEAVNGERLLVLSRQSAGPGAGARLERSVLARGVRGFRISYFGTIAPDTEPAWRDRWEGLGYLPSLLRVELETAVEPKGPTLIVKVWDAS